MGNGILLSGLLQYEVVSMATKESHMSDSGVWARRLLIGALFFSNLWIAITRRAAGPLAYPRVSAVILIGFFGPLFIGICRAEGGERPSWRMNVLLGFVLIVAIVGGLAS